MTSSMSDFVDIFSDAFSEAASSSTAGFLEEAVKESVAKAGFSVLFATASSEFTKAAIEHIVGPLLKTLLKIIDPTQKKLDALLNEPLQTGVALTRQALAVQIINENDSRLRDQLFHAALLVFETAYSYAGSRKGHNDERVYIRLAQATIAKALNAPGVVLMYLREFTSTLKERLQLAKREVAVAQENLQEASNQQTREGREKALQRRTEMLADLGPMPGPTSKPSALALELGLDSRAWHSFRQVILKEAHVPSATEIAELQERVESAEERLYRMQAFTKFWGLSID